ncbi:MAG: hypothetical protein NDF55_06905 [archaeon GB-1867-005]|nr:hypothetical protein [Candidatus Culexmicrobium cathedralense]
MDRFPTAIRDVFARKIFDSRGSPTIEVDVYTEAGFGSFSAPSGASRGRREVVAFPPGGIDEAIRAVDEMIAPELMGVDASNQFEVDGIIQQIDGTSNFSRIGGSTAIATSIAAAKAAATSLNLPLYRYLGGISASVLPLPLGNVVGGGKHSKSGGLDVQEILVLPLDADSFYEAALANVLVHKRVVELAPEGSIYGRNDEGAWVTPFGVEESLKLVKRACEDVGSELGIKIGVGIDVAASTLWSGSEGKYVYGREGFKLTPEEQLKFMVKLVEEFDLIYVEDPFHEEDYESFSELLSSVSNCLICGDDLYVTNAELIRYGSSRKAGNAVIIKPNQVGTLTSTVAAVEVAKLHGFVPVMSHRSGENVDPSIAHLAVAFNCPIIKTGVVGGERISKINELIRIEEELGGKAELASLEGVLT